VVVLRILFRLSFVPTSFVLLLLLLVSVLPPPANSLRLAVAAGTATLSSFEQLFSTDEDVGPVVVGAVLSWTNLRFFRPILVYNLLLVRCLLVVVGCWLVVLPPVWELANQLISI